MVDPQSTPARSRPSVVTISTYLLLLFAICQLISVVISLATIGTVREVMEEAYEGSTVEGAENVAGLTVALGVGSAIFLLVVAFALFGLGLVNLRGKNGSRIATWIVGGILFCCVGFSLLSGVAGGFSAPGGTSGDMPSGEEIQRRLEEALPGWVTPVTTLLGVISLISLLVALILLALPKANEFFRKPTAQWEPPAPGGTYPGQPGYPAAPGYPGATPTEPGYPGTPEPGYPASQPPAGDPGGQPGGPSGQTPPASGPDQPGEQPPTNRPG
ncbi:hypothetical protein SAMN05443287_107287 [Micromonospora phaseoli]|uniref:Uncharacterized protein n=1 Tax=Micromonospora phaseoli TaxID=1144548 RepID=A0A1H7BRC0_9ACTN|nr:hypothetical protein [Micromonospora phaseoli]PZV94941.1 hypothetical protein CLV64_10876 [Micromonospora phaseoli]GIJ79786.1 hypothetical protein Xph01_42180 [Micromonospora phaseoli]SEJ77172.1 hypothetical protein SAMN05443287_107287 [Micromonospora phaseoli]